jgi:hypothetical protein
MSKRQRRYIQAVACMRTYVFGEIFTFSLATRSVYCIMCSCICCDEVLTCQSTAFLLILDLHAHIYICLCVCVCACVREGSASLLRWWFRGKNTTLIKDKSLRVNMATNVTHGALQINIEGIHTISVSVYCTRFCRTLAIWKFLPL